MTTRISALAIDNFVKKNKINLKEYKRKHYTSFHDFFLREIKSQSRPMKLDDSILTCPCDAKASVYKISPDSHFTIKGVDYTIGEVLQNET